MSMFAKLLKGLTKSMMGVKRSRTTVFKASTPKHDLFDGWDSFVKDAVAQLQRQSDAYEYVKDTGACKYEHNIRKTIAGELFRRTNVHPDIEMVAYLEHQAALSIDYTRQLAYNIFLYEDKLRNDYTADLDTLLKMLPETA